MSLKKGILVLSLIVFLLWLSLIAVLLFVDSVVLNYVSISWLRSTLGITIYFAWLIAWYLIIKNMFRHKVKQK